ncbi:MAG TPA: methionyl-tRNA formyltransferase [bacterium]|nr:methionyl-tRNA formyltransferase [bacterium]HOL67031.1 methionyl-tRNA formyltransferase [bacterium]HPP12584.1 methionyl-tRNA formyltransferase [bacterium]
MIKIGFFGSDQFGLPCLERLHQSYQLVAVVTAPDRPCGRGYHPGQTPIKRYALSHSLPLLQPEHFDEVFVRAMRQFDPELLVLVAYGKILPEKVIRCGKLGAVNVHPSLLPAYRGAAPIEWALLNGEKETGVTVITLEKELDAGGILAQKSLSVGEDEDIFSLRSRLMALAPELLQEAIRKLLAGEKPEPQQGKVSYAPRLSKKDGEIHWGRSAREIYNQVRALADWPVAYTWLVHGEKTKLLKIRQTKIFSLQETHEKPGMVLETGQRFLVACGQGTLALLTVQLEGKRALSAPEFLKGISLSPGTILGGACEKQTGPDS